MPATDFNAAFFAKSNSTVNAEALAVFLSNVYNNQAPVYFAPTDDDTSTQLNAFRASPEFRLLKTQYTQLVSAIDAWCHSHQIQNIPPQSNKSALQEHLAILFDSNDFYSIRSLLFYNEGKRSLETLYFYLQNPHLSLEKKKDILRNLQASIIACADGTVTNILTAKDELVSSQDAQSILTQAKQLVIQQLAIAFHGLYYEDYDPPADYETHRISAYCDLVFQHYGLELRRDLTPPNMPERVLKAFPSYLDVHMRPALIIEQLITTFAPLIQQFHTELQAIFSNEGQPFTSLNFSSYNQTYREKIERRIAKWNDNYAFLCPLQVSDFFMLDGLHVSIQLFNHINLKARLATTFRTNYLTDASPIRIKIPNTYDHLDFHHDLFWMTHQGEICDLTPDLFLKLAIPSVDTVESDAYWTIFNTLLQQFTPLFSAFTASTVHQAALTALLHQPQAIWKLAHQAHFSLLQLLIQENLITPLHLAQEREIEAEARVNVVWLLTYHKQINLLSELHQQKVLLPSHLESCPVRGFWGGITPLWFLAATKQHAFIKTLLDTDHVTLPQLEISEAVEQTTRQSIIWMLCFQGKIELVHYFLALKLIPISQLQRKAQIGYLAEAPAIFILVSLGSDLRAFLPSQHMAYNLVIDLINDKLIDRIQLSTTFKGRNLFNTCALVSPLDLVIHLLHSDQLIPEDFISNAKDINPISTLEERQATEVIKLIVEKKLIIEAGKARFTNTASPIPLNESAITLHKLLERYNLKDLSAATLGKALRMAANNNAIDDLNFLLGLDKAFINQQDSTPEKRQTPLHLATIKGHIASIEALIKAGAEINIPNGAGQTALDLAKGLTPGSLKLYKLFGIQPKDAQEAALWVLVEKHGQDTLSTETFGLVFRRVAFNDETQHLQLLLTQCPDVLNQQGGSAKKTALHQAVERNNKKSVEILLQTGARVDLPDAQGNTALDLVQAMTPPNVQLLTLFSEPTSRILSILLTYYGVIHAHLGLAFRKAASMNKTEHLAFFLQIQPTILNEQGTQSGKTALHQAIENQNLASVEFLFRAGAKNDITDKSGKTARQLIEEMTPAKPEFLRFLNFSTVDNYVTTGFSEENPLTGESKRETCLCSKHAAPPPAASPVINPYNLLPATSFSSFGESASPPAVAHFSFHVVFSSSRPAAATARSQERPENSS